VKPPATTSGSVGKYRAAVGGDIRGTARAVYDIVMQADFPAIERIVARDILFHTSTGDEVRGHAEFRDYIETLKTAFPDITFVIEDVLADGDKVAVRYQVKGTFVETLWGVLPTGSEFAVRGIDIFRVVDGRVVEIWASDDTLSRMQQLGVAPQL